MFINKRRGEIKKAELFFKINVILKIGHIPDLNKSFIFKPIQKQSV